MVVWIRPWSTSSDTRFSNRLCSTISAAWNMERANMNSQWSDRLLRDMFREKTSRILNQLIDNGILEPVEEKT